MPTLHVPRYAAPIGLVLALSATAELAHGQSMGPPLRTVAVVGPTHITDSDLAAAAGNKLLAIETQLHRARQAVLDNLVTDALLALASKERGLSVEQLVRLEIEQKAKPVGVEEVKAVLDSARERLGASSETDAMASIRSSMEQSRIAARRLDYVNELRRRFNVEYRLPPPRADVRVTDSPAKGVATAPVLITVFSDFECPFCARHAAAMRELVGHFDKQVRLEFRHFPLPFHKSAPKASEAAACANEQGRFWEMHDRLFERQKNLGADDLKRHATELALNTESFSACVDSGRYAERVRHDKQDGERLGVAATPATFINGRLVPGAVPLSEFVSVVEEELVGTAKSQAAVSPSEQAVKR